MIQPRNYSKNQRYENPAGEKAQRRTANSFGGGVIRLLSARRVSVEKPSLNFYRKHFFRKTAIATRRKI
jgi:hypothetical protein